MGIAFASGHIFTNILLSISLEMSPVKTKRRMTQLNLRFLYVMITLADGHSEALLVATFSEPLKTPLYVPQSLQVIQSYGMFTLPPGLRSISGVLAGRGLPGFRKTKQKYRYGDKLLFQRYNESFIKQVEENVPWGENTLFTLEFREDLNKYAVHTCNNMYLMRDGRLVPELSKVKSR